MAELLWENRLVVSVLGALSVLMVLLTIIALPLILVRLPDDYFTAHRRPVHWGSTSHVLWIALKNLLGWILIVLGVLMLVLPGQGLLTIFAGLVLIDFPGKYRLERWLVRRPRILSSINWIRRRSGHGPLQTEMGEADTRSSDP